MLPTVRGGWRCVLADPPWRFNDSNTRGAAERHYPTMAYFDLVGLQLWKYVARDAVLALWTPDTHLEEALALSRVWGFTYRHLIVWGKVRHHPSGPTIQIGLGHRFRKAHEVALLCDRGKPAVLDHSLPSLILAPRGIHSAKPEAMHSLLERYCDGPRLELFARRRRPNWTTWGNEVR